MLGLSSGRRAGQDQRHLGRHGRQKTRTDLVCLVGRNILAKLGGERSAAPRRPRAQPAREMSPGAADHNTALSAGPGASSLAPLESAVICLRGVGCCNCNSMPIDQPLRKRRRKALLAFALLGLLLFSSSSQLRLSAKGYAAAVFDVGQAKRRRRPVADLDRCRALRLHERGAWRHSYFSNVTVNDTVGRGDVASVLGGNEFRRIYTSLERDWLAGRNLPAGGFGKKGGCNQHRDKLGLAYTSPMGNQCGCGLPDFRPSHSVWAYPEQSSDERCAQQPELPAG